MSGRLPKRPSGGAPLGKVYPITGASAAFRGTTIELVTEFLRGGARLLQIREKGMPDDSFCRLLKEVRSVCLEWEARLIVNDRPDLALAIGADGVHLGQDDVPVEEARRLLGPRAVIGLSTHDARQFEDAQSRPLDYVALGPIFATATKPGRNAEIGVERFREMARRSRLPVVAIGGITLASAPGLWRAGATSVAVISDLTKDGRPAERVREYLSAGEENQL